MSKAVDSLRDLFPSLSLSFHITSEEEEEELRRKNKGVGVASSKLQAPAEIY